MHKSSSIPWLILLASMSLSAQTPTYDAVAIKPDKSDSGSSMFNTRDDTFVGTNVTIKQLLALAYDIRSGLIFGLPSWAESAHFDINAKIVDYDAATMKNLTREQRRSMAQAMVESRFHVKVHTETKQQPVYDLVVAKEGAKVTSSPAPSPSDMAGNAPNRRGNMGINSSSGNMTMTGSAITLESFANMMSGQLDRTVIDKTALPGEFDIHLKWTSETAPQPVADDAPPLLFTAIQEQLGLKLQSSKGPVKTLVVDHVERPTEN